MGMEYIARVCEVALAGNHSVTFVGNPRNGEKEIREVLQMQREASYYPKIDSIQFVRPCYCGNYRDPKQACVCESRDIISYRNTQIPKAEMIIELAPPAKLELYPWECLKNIRRFKELPKKKKVVLKEESIVLLQKAWDHLALDLQDVQDILNVLMTIAFIDNRKDVNTQDVAEAIQYKSLK